MKTFALVALLAIGLMAGCCTSHHQHAFRTWEYRVVRGVAHSPDLQDKLNVAGAEGFAIASSQTLPGDANTSPITIVILQKAKY